jgi:hypothetical protein
MVSESSFACDRKPIIHIIYGSFDDRHGIASAERHQNQASRLDGVPG